MEMNISSTNTLSFKSLGAVRLH